MEPHVLLPGGLQSLHEFVLGMSQIPVYFANGAQPSREIIEYPKLEVGHRDH